MVTSDSGLRLGIDLGGTKTEAVVLRVGTDTPEILARLRRATEGEAGYQAIVDAVAATLERRIEGGGGRG